MPYNITRSNGTTQTIPDGSIDTSKYSVGVLGRNALGYGATTAESLVRHLENFAHTSAPIQPIPGQLWYDTATGFMKFNTATVDNDNTWTRLVFADDLGNIGAEGDPWETIFANQLGSTNDKINTIYADTIGTNAHPTGLIQASSILAAGIGTISDPIDIIYADIIGASGNPVDEIYVNTPTNLLHAANRGYVDSTTVASAGDTMTGFLTLNANPTNNLHAATKQYVDSTTVASAGDTMTGFLTLHADPSNAMHAVTKQYADSIAAGLDVKDSCRVATTANITLSGLQTIDGITLAANNRVLVKDQSNPVDNGIYNAQSGAWNRAPDADGSPANEVTSGMYTFITAGTANGATGWILTTPDPITVGSTALNFTQGSAATDYIGGDGIDISGNTIEVDTTVIRTSGNQTMSGIKTFSSQISLSTGSDSSPSLRFSSNTDTGIYYHAAEAGFGDSLRVTVNGDDKIRVADGVFPTGGTMIYGDMRIGIGNTTTNVWVESGSSGESILTLAPLNSVTQGSGRLYVGQGSTIGGGIAYIGDATPGFGDLQSDNITLYRTDSGTSSWTARNPYNSNNWEFRGTVTATSFLQSGGGSFVDTTTNQSIGGTKTFTSPILIPYGDNTNPGLSFSSNTNTGLTGSSSTVSIIRNGSTRMTVGLNVDIHGSLDMNNNGIGSARSVSISYGSSTDVGGTILPTGLANYFGSDPEAGLAFECRPEPTTGHQANFDFYAAEADSTLGCTMTLRPVHPNPTVGVDNFHSSAVGDRVTRHRSMTRVSGSHAEVSSISTYLDSVVSSSNFTTSLHFNVRDGGSNETKLIIGDTSSDFTDQVNAPAFNTTSALKYKTEVESFENALDKIKAVDVITYKRKDTDDDKRYLGVTAESLAEVVPELVSFKDGEADAVNYAQGFALATQAIQEQESRYENADLAEYYMADKPYEPGTVMIIGGNEEVTECHHDKSMDVFGVVSSNPALTINQKMHGDKNAVEIALAGRVPVKVVGPVKKGQRLVSADRPGHAMAISNEDLLSLSTLVIIGRALKDKPDDGAGLVLAAIGHC